MPDDQDLSELYALLHGSEDDVDIVDNSDDSIIDDVVNQSEFDEKQIDVDDVLDDQPDFIKNEIKKPDKKAEYDPLDDLEDINDDSSAVMRPSVSIIENLDNKPIAPAVLPVDIESYKEQLNVVTQEVLDACRSDRQEAQLVISDLQNRMSAVPVNAAPSKALVDGLVKAIEVKASINQNAIKIMDTNAKFLASIKANLNFNFGDKGSSTSAEELNRILQNDYDGD